MSEPSKKRSLGAKTLAAPTPAWLVGTYDGEGKPNVAAIAWGGICSSGPPCVAVSLRAARHTHGSIIARKAFTVNVPSERYVREVDFAGIVSGRDTDKFAAAGLTPVRSDLVDAPYVGEFPLVLECRLLQTVELGLHTQFIGEIVDVKAAEEVMGVDGMPDAAKIAAFSYDPGSRNYFATGNVLGAGFSVGRELIPVKETAEVRE
jgi:flavin reductase (DIM6/NTAB) family NADH-FMN oxidoreductase RutF